jgi:putative urate catabolism protein
MNRYPRNMQGYGPNPPVANWPNGAKIAVQFVVNYEEGGENCILHGDSASEAFLSEVVGAQPWVGQRHWNMESMYEYGARAGFWRLHRLFTEHDVPVTVYGVATALERSPHQVAAMQSADWEIASHGLKWIEYKDFAKEDERDHLVEAIRIHTEVTGERPRGWYTGRCSANTVDIVSEEGGFAYCSDTYDDDLPYWRNHDGADQLIIPYTLDANDMRFASAQGFNSGDQFFTYLKDRHTKDDDHRPALPPDRQTWPRAIPAPLYRIRQSKNRRLVCPPHRHRKSLAHKPPTRGSRRDTNRPRP